LNESSVEYNVHPMWQELLWLPESSRTASTMTVAVALLQAQ